MKIFHTTYTSIICVLNARHLCAKHTNLQKNNFHMIFITKSWDCKSVISVSHMKHSALSRPLQQPFACICKLNTNVYQHCKLKNDLLHGSSTTISWTHMFQDLGCHEDWRELHFNVQNAMKGNIAKILWVALEFQQHHPVINKP